DHPLAPDALSQAASAYSRVNKPREAVSRYQQIIEKYPDYARLERAYLNIVDVLRDASDDAEALRWTRQTQEVFRGKLPEALALFAQARIRIAQNDWQNALADLEKLLAFSDLGGTRVPGGTNKAEITFLKGFVLEQLGRFGEAIETYLSIPDGRNEYYGWRATERLRALAKNEKLKLFVEKAKIQFANELSNSAPETQKKAAQNILRLTDEKEAQNKLLETLRKTYAVLPAYQKVPSFNLLEFGRKEALKEKPETAGKNRHEILADELLFLGLYDEGTPELEISLAENKSQRPKTEDLNYTLAVFYKRGDMAHRAVGFIEPLWRNVPSDYQIELISRDQAELLYPAPYADSLTKYAPERKLDPRYILSIMRQESRFRADVKSVAAARGLMQFISSTAGRIAKELGKENFQQDELYHPPTAVLYGSQYLANLFRQFPNQPEAVAASYNGGETNMERWMARSKSIEADRYVPEIIFSQSKDYVYRVMANYRVYQMLYDENLKRK
ncbi:MAG TPA: lytic transglycosylase domain-containing protein, partial [Pyrinomonadaceae bacterium]|nr:lytic transglycosylase domain-containing protein [Pyrinomonadaceae bacterium]